MIEKTKRAIVTIKNVEIIETEETIVNLITVINIASILTDVYAMPIFYLVG